MNLDLNIDAAIKGANGALRRFPGLIVLPMVLVGVVNYALAQQIDPTAHRHLLVLLVLLFSCTLLSYWLAVVVSAMYLRVREGGEPDVRQFGEVLDYPGFGSFIAGLVLRTLGRIILGSLIFGGIWFVVLVVATLAHGVGAGGSGIGATAGGITAHVWSFSVIFGIIFPFAYYPYVFALPRFAMGRGAGPGFLAQCAWEARKIWQTAAVVAFAECAPVLFKVNIKLLAAGHFVLPHAVQLAANLSMVLLTECFAVWFILVKTEFAVQSASAQLPPEPPFGAISAELLPQR